MRQAGRNAPTQATRTRRTLGIHVAWSILAASAVIPASAQGPPVPVPPSFIGPIQEIPLPDGDRPAAPGSGATPPPPASKLGLLDADLFRSAGFDVGKPRVDLRSAVEKHLDAANDLMEAGRYRAALVEANQVIRLLPDDPDALGIRGEIYTRLQMCRHAIRDFDRLLAMNPTGTDRFDVLMARGIAHCADRDMARGLADFEAALPLAGDPVASAHLLKLRAYHLQRSGDWERARDDYERSRALDPAHFGVQLNLGQCYARLGRNDLAIAEFDRAIAAQPISAQAYFSRAEAREALGDLGGALDDRDRSIALAPETAWTHQGRGWNFVRRGLPDAALADLDRAIDLDPGYAASYTARGWAYLRKGDLDRATADFEKAGQLDSPRRLMLLYHYGWALARFAPLDHPMVEFEGRCDEAPSLPFALVVEQGDAARSASLEGSEFAAFFLIRPAARPGLAPVLAFSLTTVWGRVRPEAATSDLGLAIIAARRADWREAVKELDFALAMLLESRCPGVTRGKLWDELLDQ